MVYRKLLIFKMIILLLDKLARSQVMSMNINMLVRQVGLKTTALSNPFVDYKETATLQFGGPVVTSSVNPLVVLVVTPPPVHL